jgi:hypothetical protein
MRSDNSLKALSHLYTFPRYIDNILSLDIIPDLDAHPAVIDDERSTSDIAFQIARQIDREIANIFWETKPV